MVHVVYLVLAVLLAVYAAKLLIDGGVAISHRLGIPQFVIGAVVIGFGSSMPEFAVNVQAAVNGDTDLALGNILGSNLFNLCVTLGLIGLLSPIVVGVDTVKKDLPMHFMAALMVGLCGNQLLLDHIDYHHIMRSHGIILLCFFSIYLYYTMLEVFADSPYKTPLHHSQHQQLNKEAEMPLWRAVLYIVLGLVGLVLGGELIVEQAVELATMFGLSNHLVGLLIVGPGTSMPELIACLLALYRRSTDMIIGNVIGSNLFNIFFTLGVTAIIAPVPLDPSMNRGILVNISIALLLMLAMWVLPKKQIGRPLALVLLLTYCGYMYSII